MRGGWRIAKLDEIISFERGLTYAKGDEVAHSSLGVLRSNNVDLITQSLNLDEIKYLREDFEVPAKKKVRKNTLLMCMSNGSKDHLGKVALIDRDLDYAFGGFMGLLTPDAAKVFPKYLYYALASKSFKDYIHSLADGANINNLKYKDLAAYVILLPSLTEQQRIVDILDREFVKIDALKANAEKSLQAAKDLFQATLKKELEPKEGWKSAQLKDIATIRPPKKELNALPLDLPVSFLPMEDLGIMDFDISPTQTKTLGELAGSYTYFAEGDVLLAKVTPCFENGKQGIARHLTNGIGFGSSEYIVYRPGNEIFADFLYYFLATNDFHDRGKKQMHGACGLKRLAKEIAEQSIISFPDIEVQKKVAARIREEECKITNLQQNYQKTLTLCDDLKQSLLRKAFNGEL